MKYIVIVIIGLILLTRNSYAEINCFDAEGEAAIINGDVPSAKAEAIGRAKWTAIEQAAGVEIKAQTIVQNTMMVDDAISSKIRGVITKVRELGTTKKDITVMVRINACVEPAKAKEAVGDLALNNAVSVFIPARKPGIGGKPGGYEEMNFLSETLVGRLAEQGYTVVDIAAEHALDADYIGKSLKSGDFSDLLKVMYRFFTNVVLMGKVEYTVSTKKGEDIGYGLAMPFNNVTAKLTYRLITKNEDGKMIILAAGTEQGVGLANNIEDAVAAGLQDVTSKITPLMLDKISQHVKSSARKIDLTVDGVTVLCDNFAVKDVLQNITWVTEVEEKSMGKFSVTYPENSIYLANSLSQKGMKVKNFSATALTVNYSAPPRHTPAR